MKNEADDPNERCTVEPFATTPIVIAESLPSTIDRDGTVVLPSASMSSVPVASNGSAGIPLPAVGVNTAKHRVARFTFMVVRGSPSEQPPLQPTN